MHQERARRKETEEKLRESELRAAKAEERLGVLSELMNAAQQNGQQPQQQQQQRPSLDEVVDPEVDVFAAVQQLQRQNSMLQSERNEQRVLETAKADMIQFTKQTPDFFDGVQHLVKARDKELEIMGMSDPKQRVRQIAIEEKVLMQQAIAENRSPAGVLYALAQQRGFAGGRRPQAPQVPQPSRQAVDQVQRIQNGVNASATLSGAGGTGGAGLTVQQLADMPEDQFDALIQKMGGVASPAVRRAFGGQ